MHPSKDILRDFVDNRIDDEIIYLDIKNHLLDCELCQAYCENYKRIYDDQLPDDLSEISEEGQKLRESLINQLNRENIIWLFLKEQDLPVQTVLAADTEEENKPLLENLTELYSEDPKVLLRVMRDNTVNNDFVELISEDESMSPYAMIHIPDLGKDILLDHTGKADLGFRFDDSISLERWQIRLPDANFTLKPHIYNPEEVKSEKDIILEANHKDKIKIRLLQKQEGVQLEVMLLKLNGEEEYKPARAVISQKNISHPDSIKPNQKIQFDLDNIEDEIIIRIYRND